MTKNEFRSLSPEELGPQGAYRLLTYAVAPRPIALVSTVSEDGLPNLAPYSFYMAGGANPPSVAFSPTASRNGEKDTLRNIRETGEFTISVATYEQRDRINAASVAHPHGVSEWAEAGFEAAPSILVRPARIADSPLALECRLFQIVPHGDGPSAANYVIGEVVYFHVAHAVLNDAGDVDPARIAYLSRLGGDWYDRTDPDTLFALPRPG